jgi:hypothetical protein
MNVVRGFAIILSVAFAGTLCAQDKLWSGQFGGGWSMPESATADKLNNGWHVMGGALMHMNERLSLRFDAQYDRFNASRATLDSLRVPDAYAEVWTGTGGLQLTLNPQSGLRFYGFGNVGGYYKRAVATRPTLVPGIICDPWWDFCFEGLVPANTVLGTKSNTTFGGNAGVGVEFGAPHRTSVFVEAKYQWVSAGQAVEYVPITVGFRW